MVQQLLAVQTRLAQVSPYLPKPIQRRAPRIRRRRRSCGRGILRRALWQSFVMLRRQLGRSGEGWSSMAAAFVAAMPAFLRGFSLLSIPLDVRVRLRCLPKCPACGRRTGREPLLWRRLLGRAVRLGHVEDTLEGMVHLPTAGWYRRVEEELKAL